MMNLADYLVIRISLVRFIICIYFLQSSVSTPIVDFG